jgi:hypothetical protein
MRSFNFIEEKTMHSKKLCNSRVRFITEKFNIADGISQDLSHCKTMLLRFKLTTVVVIGTDCTGSCKSNYHTITATTTLK